MAQSKSSKKIQNMVYGLGAAIVIIGALFKIQHISFGFLTGGVMLTIGLAVEAAVFAYSAFEPIDDELDWTKVYPELGDDSLESTGANGLLSQKLDNLLQEANVDSELMSSLGNSIKDFSGAAEGLSAAAETITATNKYNDQMALAATQMESLNGLYQVQMESLNGLYEEQKESLNGLHQMHVESASKQAELNAELSNVVSESAEKLKEQMESLASNLSSLNGVYGGMLSAMSSK